MYSGYCSYRSSRIHYCRWGSGGRLLLCFHGYGENTDSFSLFEAVLGEEYTILAIDMPFHGLTEWKEGTQFLPGELAEIVLKIVGDATTANLSPAADTSPVVDTSHVVDTSPAADTSHPADTSKEGTIATNGDAPGRPEAPISIPAGDWTIFGYSMGGRVALSLLELMPDHISKMVLLAPDGLRVNGWYWLATRTWLGGLLFRHTMRRPGWLFLWLRAGNRLGLVNRSIFKFAHHYIDDPEARWNLYTRWTTMRALRPKLAKIQHWAAVHSIPFRILYGRFDRVIRRDGGDRFCAGLNQALQRARQKDGDAACQLIILPGGHRLLEPAFVNALAEAIRH